MSIFSLYFEEPPRAFEIKLESTDDVRSGIGSSGFELCFRSGKRCVKGSGWSVSAVLKVVMSVNVSVDI